MMYLILIKYVYLTIAVFFGFYQFASSAENSTSNSSTPDYLESLLNSKKYNEFIKILQIPNTDLVDPSQRKSLYNELGFYNGLALGDILLRPGQILNPEQESDFNGNIKLSINKWKNGIVPYYISKAFSDNHTEIIKNALQYNNQELGPNINYRPYHNGDNDYVFFFNGGSGCYTNLGNVGGPQVISLSEPCLFIDGWVKHETQHVLGIAHEHNRSDRDDYIELHTENIPQVSKPQYVKYTSDSLVNTGPYDYYSLMFYPKKTPGFNINSFVFLQNGIDDVSAPTKLSPTDIQRVKTLYS